MFLYLCPIQVSCSSTQRIFVIMEAPGAPSPATLSRPMPAELRRKSAAPTLEVEETRPPSRVHQAHTVPGSYHGALGSQPNVAGVFPASRWAKTIGTLTNAYDYCIVPHIPVRQGIPKAREQGPGVPPQPPSLARCRPSRDRTPRRRGDPAPVARSPVAHGSRQLSRCPRKPAKRCGCIHSFFLGENIGYVDHWI